MKACLENYKFEAETAIVNAEAQRLREEGCDIVVWSSHNSVGNMPALTTVDAAFGGHEHVAKKETKGSVPYYATPEYGKAIAHVQLKIEKATSTVSYNEEASSIEYSATFGEALAEEEKVSSIRSQYAAATDEIKHIKIGSTDETLKLDNQLANLCVKAMYEEATEFAREAELEVNLVAAFHNKAGGVRCDIAAGEINYGHVYSAFPFDNEIVIVEVTGQKAKNLFKDNKVLGLAIYHTYEGYAEFQNDQKYHYITTDYLATSSKVFNLKDTDFTRTGIFVRDVVAQKIKDLGNVKAKDFTKEANDAFAPVV